MRALGGWRGHAWLAVPLRLYLGVLFLYAAVHKVADPAAFALDVATYEILPLGLVNLTAITLPWIEIVAGALLLAGLRVRPAAIVVAALMAVFLLALVLALVRGLDMSCGCFASQAAESDPISWRTVLRDLVWLAMAVHVAVFDRARLSVAHLIRKGVPP